ncbi:MULTISPECIES: hypothetical protein [unclassified Nocardioides]|uniref:hypothetical protein n=1 Tax=unclassified Nocardioides TaxID=2615069 RepID=UPI003613EC05
MSAWLWPTIRSISWVPLAGVTACLAALAALAEYAGAWPASMTGLAAAAVAGAIVAGMRDPAAALLSAVPTSVAVRRARRIALLVPAGLGVWLALVGGSLLGLLALTAAGLAVSVWASVPLGVAVPLLWVIVARAVEHDWDLRPELVTVAAGAALWMGRDR